MKQYTREDCINFINDMEKLNLEVNHYKGRFFWEGPSVVVENLQKVLSNTKVKCQWDNMGFDFIVYPITSDKGE